MTDQQAVSLFVRHLRWALHHLYDPGALRKSPLVPLLGLEAQEGAPALRRTLLAAIDALKPRANVPPQAKGWRIYRALYHRYAEQFSPHEVAKALGLSIRQLRRQEAVALQALADQLWVQHGLTAEAVAALADMEPELEEPPGDEPIEAPSREQELTWVGQSQPSETVAVDEVMQATLKVAAPLLAALGVAAECALPPQLPRVAVQSGTWRQALLNTLTAAIRAVPGGRVTIGAEWTGAQVCVRVQPAGGAARAAGDYAESLQMAHQLTALCGGSLEIASAPPGSPFIACFSLPAAARVGVLVIDDNADTLQLFQRYLGGMPYPFIGARDPQTALALARELIPRAIVLDVMLPGVDGWEVLGRLREDPRTAAIPVIVCTILPEEDLAMALGAAAFLRKPISRPDLLATLERLLQTGPRQEFEN